jgi:threonine synthase
VTVINRCRAHGAELLLSPGTLVKEAGLLAGRNDGYWKPSTLKEPSRAECKKTLGLELVERLHSSARERSVHPLRGGTGIVGMAKAFEELGALGWFDDRRPPDGAGQIEGCASVVRALAEGNDSAPAWEDPHAEVWGLGIRKTSDDFLVLGGGALRAAHRDAVAVALDPVRPMIDRVALTDGIWLGQEGATALAAAEDLNQSALIAPGEHVVFQTGDPANYH